MQFQPLSDFSAPAEISVKGLKAEFHDDKPRDIYVYIYPKNMPAPGRKPIFLPTDKMAATRRFAGSICRQGAIRITSRGSPGGLGSIANPNQKLLTAQSRRRSQ